MGIYELLALLGAYLMLTGLTFFAASIFRQEVSNIQTDGEGADNKYRKLLVPDCI